MGGKEWEERPGSFAAGSEPRAQELTWRAQWAKERTQGAAQSEARCPGWRVLFGERICSQRKVAIYNRGTVICWLEPSKKSSSETYGFRDFPGIGQLVLSSKHDGGQWEKTLSLPLVVPDRLFSVSGIWLQVEKLKWIWLKHFKLGHLKTGTLLVHQSPPIEIAFLHKEPTLQPRILALSSRVRDSGLKNSGKSSEVDKIQLASPSVHSFSLLALHNVHLVNGPPCNGVSFICVYETVYTDAHTTALGWGLESVGWVGRDHWEHLVTKSREGCAMETKVETMWLSFTWARTLPS